MWSPKYCKIRHDYYKCPVAFFEHYTTPISESCFTVEGFIVEPHLYWVNGTPDAQINSKIASSWEGHLWTVEIQTEMSTMIIVSALRQLTNNN